MYFLEHEPPHIHIAFAGRRATMEIRTGVVRGPLPQRAARHVRGWLALHRNAIKTNWARARRGEPLRDPARFAEAYVDADLGTVAWPNGADVAPEYLYEAVRRSNAVAEPPPRP